MWIRDYLPRDAPNARILTYGYPATLQGNTSISTIQDYTTTFVQSLIGMRDSAEVRATIALYGQLATLEEFVGMILANACCPRINQ
jgi:hypothetical protein